MATTLIENIVNELTELIVQKVLEEFNQRTDEVAARLNALERADFVRQVDLNQKFIERADSLSPIVEARLVAMENVLAAQPLVDKNFVDERVKTWADRNLHEAVVEIVDNYDIDHKIQNAIEDTDFDDDFDDAIKEAVYQRIDDELENKGFIDEEDLQRYLDQYRFVTEGSLIEFINDRVRLTTE